MAPVLIRMATWVIGGFLSAQMHVVAPTLLALAAIGGSYVFATPTPERRRCSWTCLATLLVLVVVVVGAAIHLKECFEIVAVGTLRVACL
jgi:hypothetical protein